MPLTNNAIRTSNTSNKPTRLVDERGLYVEVPFGHGRGLSLIGAVNTPSRENIGNEIALVTSRR
jgi:hypothetical protein